MLRLEPDPEPQEEPPPEDAHFDCLTGVKYVFRMLVPWVVEVCAEQEGESPIESMWLESLDDDSYVAELPRELATEVDGYLRFAFPPGSEGAYVISIQSEGERAILWEGLRLPVRVDAFEPVDDVEDDADSEGDDEPLELGDICAPEPAPELVVVHLQLVDRLDHPLPGGTATPCFGSTKTGACWTHSPANARSSGWPGPTRPSESPAAASTSAI